MKERTYRLCENADDPEDKLVIMPWLQRDSRIHDHDSFELTYVLEGSAVQTINEEQKTVGKGDYFIIDYGSIHSYRNTRDFKLLNCQFFSEVIDDTLAGYHAFDELLNVCLVRYHRQYPGRTPVNRIFHDDDGSVLILLEGIQREYKRKETGYREVFRGRLLEILIITMRKVVREQIAQEKRCSKESRIVLETVHFMKEHFEEKAVLTRFCRENHYSQQYVSRKFKQDSGLTALEYLQKIRIKKSCEFLAGSDMSIQEIAYKVGYETVKFYQQVFRRMVGMTPSEYRKLVLTDQN